MNQSAFLQNLFDAEMQKIMENKKKEKPNTSLEEVKKQIKNIFDLSDYRPSERDFRIQYTVFEYAGNVETDFSNESSKMDSWYMNCILSETKDEGIYECNITYAEQTAIEFASYKGNYQDFLLSGSVDKRKCSDNQKIYVIDLYPNFVPKHFKGTCITRGGFNGWNYFNF